MLAGSERTWRPVGARIAGIIAIAVLTIVCAIAWWALGPEIRSHFTWGQRLTLIGCFLGLFAAWWAMARSRLLATEQGVRVVNGYRTHEFEWAQVVAIHLNQGAPWAVLDLSDGETLSVFAVQGSDGARARQAVREFRALLAEHGPADHT